MCQDMESEEEGSAAPSAPVKKAAAAMAVGVGSFKDPVELQVRNCNVNQSLMFKLLKPSSSAA